MTQLIFAVEKPKNDSHQNDQRWRGCSANLSVLANKNKDIQQLGENVLLISLDNNLDGIAKVIDEILGLGYKYTILNEDTKWIAVPSRD